MKSMRIQCAIKNFSFQKFFIPLICQFEWMCQMSIDFIRLLSLWFSIWISGWVHFNVLVLLGMWTLKNEQRIDKPTLLCIWRALMMLSHSPKIELNWCGHRNRIFQTVFGIRVCIVTGNTRLQLNFF